MSSDYFANIHFFEGLDDKSYKASAKFKMTDGSDLKIKGAAVDGSGINDGGVYGALTMNDWNEDGLLDILFSARHCPLIVFYNEGEEGAPVYGAHDTIKIGVDVFLDDRPRLSVSDINLDGKKDLIFGRDKIVSYSINTGTNEAPEFEELSDAMKNNGDPIYMKYGADVIEANPIHGETQVSVVDWNNDGYPDLLVGENTGWTIGGPLEYLFVFKGIPEGSVFNMKSALNSDINSSIVYSGVNRTVTCKGFKGRLQIITSNGRIVKEVSLKENSTVQLNDLAKGLYTLHFYGNHEKFNKRIIVQ